MSGIEGFVDALNRDDRLSLARNVLFAVSLGLLVFGLVLVLGGDRRAAAPESLWLWLPGWVIALVWLVLLAFLGASRWLLNSYTIIGVGQARGLVTLLILVCLCWPLHSLVAGSLSFALAANGATFLLTAVAMLFVWQSSRDAAYLLVPLMAWLVFISIIILAAMGQT
ncbi:MAG: tryptophan-rich sensory protein [Dehalococcoidia bacterium]|jgi:tryptophan-rich sensory protein|nr:tryptophan-rich sensory protein [Dehalococcoidia bacterium]